MGYVMKVLLAGDRLLNTLLLGSPEETISARSGRWAARQDKGIKRRVGSLLCGVLDAVDPGHCAAARDAQLLRHRWPEKRIAQAFPWRGRAGNQSKESDYG